MRSLIRISGLVLSLLLVAAAVGCGPSNGASLQASGLIEAVEVNVAPELSGRVAEVLVAEGDAVQAGQVLLRLDDSLLQAERRAAEAALATAEAGLQAAHEGLNTAQLQYDLTLDAALAQEAAVRTQDWALGAPAGFDQPNWYFGRGERMTALEAEIVDGEQAVQAAETNLATVSAQAGGADFVAAEADLLRAQAAVTVARSVLNAASRATDAAELRRQAQENYDDARDALDEAQAAYDDLLTTDGARDVLEARAALSLSRERLAAARDALRLLRTGAASPEVALAAQAVAQAKALVTQAQAGVDQVQAQLDLIDLQLERTAVTAPIDGVVLTLGVRAGEVAQAGLPVLTVADLNSLTVTVYISEDRYGEVSLGDQAILRVDSFPGQTFSATVTRIADQAEYTPRNVQTSEQRQTTVYAVELSVANADGRLKPGMPADVEFAGE